MRVPVTLRQSVAYSAANTKEVQLLHDCILLDVEADSGKCLVEMDHEVAPFWVNGDSLFDYGSGTVETVGCLPKEGEMIEVMEVERQYEALVPACGPGYRVATAVEVFQRRCVHVSYHGCSSSLDEIVTVERCYPARTLSPLCARRGSAKLAYSPALEGTLETLRTEPGVWMLEVVNSGSNGDDLDRGNDDVIINFIGSADALLRLLPPIRMHCSMAGELLSLCEEQELLKKALEKRRWVLSHGVRKKINVERDQWKVTVGEKYWAVDSVREMERIHEVSVDTTERTIEVLGEDEQAVEAAMDILEITRRSITLPSECRPVVLGADGSRLRQIVETSGVSGMRLTPTGLVVSGRRGCVKKSLKMVELAIKLDAKARELEKGMEELYEDVKRFGDELGRPVDNPKKGRNNSVGVRPTGAKSASTATDQSGLVKDSDGSSQVSSVWERVVYGNEIDNPRKHGAGWKQSDFPILGESSDISMGAESFQAEAQKSVLSVGSEVEGTCLRILNFGAFFDVGGENDVLLPRGKFGGLDLSVGDKLNVRVIEMDVERERCIVVPVAPSVKGSCLFVGNLPLDAPADEVRELFSKYGSVFRVGLPMAPGGEGSQSKGFAFVHFSENEAAASVLDHVGSGLRLRDRDLRVRLADSSGPRARLRGTEEEALGGKVGCVGEERQQVLAHVPTHPARSREVETESGSYSLKLPVITLSSFLLPPELQS